MEQHRFGDIRSAHRVASALVVTPEQRILNRDFHSTNAAVTPGLTPILVAHVPPVDLPSTMKLLPRTPTTTRPAARPMLFSSNAHTRFRIAERRWSPESGAGELALAKKRFSFGEAAVAGWDADGDEGATGHT
ncbi:hypothetical protein JHW43_005948 [Diplocarpon mali]|nr:hypothetical protein JHW43_005948 [Diplocarpon mali]